MGAVTTSFLVREADILVPGSLLMITGGEGCASDEPCPCVTVAREMKSSVMSKPAGGGGGLGAPPAGGGKVIRDTESGLESASASAISDGLVPSEEPNAISEIDEEVLVDIMDAETGLCLSKRVPVGELRHSTSFFGRELDVGGTTVQQV